MLQNTFCHLPSISLKTERQLWDAGVHCWEQCVPASKALTPRRMAVIAQHLPESHTQLASGNPSYFQDLLPAGEQWRLFEEFRKTAAYVDIETTGLGGPGDHITTIALYDGSAVRHYVFGQNLDDFPHDIREYKLLVTFNGKCFDVPFIEKFFRIRLGMAHIDLRYVLKSVGYAGGLKKVERKLGIDRKDLQDVDGFFAVLLWKEYKERRNAAALETLLAYNIADVVNLEPLMVTAYNLKLRSTPFSESHALAVPQGPELPFKPDREVIEYVRRRYPWWNE